MFGNRTSLTKPETFSEGLPVNIIEVGLPQSLSWPNHEFLTNLEQQPCVSFLRFILKSNQDATLVAIILHMFYNWILLLMIFFLTTSIVHSDIMKASQNGVNFQFSSSLISLCPVKKVIFFSRTIKSDHQVLIYNQEHWQEPVLFCGSVDGSLTIPSRIGILQVPWNSIFLVPSEFWEEHYSLER